MNIDRFKHEHVSILESIATLRRLTQSGVATHAAQIAQGVVAMSSLIKLHLAVEDRVLYPALQNGSDAQLARLGQRFQQEMGAIANAYMAFARRWNTAEAVRGDEAGFKADANTVLRQVYERMQRENHDFYPRIEAMDAVAA
ncbi:hemerythrin domain-containing protein [Simplicispira psychrophila]|uniref:hemerythrin domain-containing protein n=1 Tax=Simplicispira psychrophila TaxID=80882 RepID=UPI00047FBA18|nr:hemerythrin domain-containing protein [Simplicispira psychrophila]